MKITLMNYTPLEVCAHAIRTCHSSFSKSDTHLDAFESVSGEVNNITLEAARTADYYIGKKDKELIDRVGNKLKHSSTLEHLVYSFYIQGISRACLQELSRHRMASLSVKSTRYTLKELRKEPPFDDGDSQRAKKYIVMTGKTMVDAMSIRALENLRRVLASGVSNDQAKYCLIESYKTELTWTINLRSLMNFLELRTDKAALWEIRALGVKIVEAMPNEHLYLIDDIVARHLGEDKLKEILDKKGITDYPRQRGERREE